KTEVVIPLDLIGFPDESHQWERVRPQCLGDAFSLVLSIKPAARVGLGRGPLLRHHPPAVRDDIQGKRAEIKLEIFEPGAGRDDHRLLSLDGPNRPEGREPPAGRFATGLAASTPPGHPSPLGSDRGSGSLSGSGSPLSPNRALHVHPLTGGRRLLA